MINHVGFLYFRVLPSIFCCIGNECCERLAYYGMSTNLVNYLQDRLNQGNVRASTTVSNWQGTCYVTPLLGAFLADAYLGRYWTIAGFSIIYFFVSLSCFQKKYISCSHINKNGFVRKKICLNVIANYFRELLFIRTNNCASCIKVLQYVHKMLSTVVTRFYEHY